MQWEPQLWRRKVIKSNHRTKKTNILTNTQASQHVHFCYLYFCGFLYQDCYSRPRNVPRIYEQEQQNLTQTLSDVNKTNATSMKQLGEMCRQKQHKCSALRDCRLHTLLQPVSVWSQSHRTQPCWCCVRFWTHIWQCGSVDFPCSSATVSYTAPPMQQLHLKLEGSQ